MKSLYFVLFALGLLLPFNGYTQEIFDCSLARVVCNNEDLAFNPDGPGQNDFTDPDNDPGCITALEQHSAWYYFEIDPTAPPDLVLGFIIHPKGGLGEDYDWALYGPDVNCGNLGSPIRCSSSSEFCGFCPETGMGMGTTDFTEGPGTGDGFVSTLVVQPGQGFYLLIDNWKGTTNGFILEWTDTAEQYLNCAATPPCALNADAGEDIETCEGDETTVLEGSSTGNHGSETYSWTGSNGGTGFLSDPNIASPMVSLPGGFSGTIIYTLTVIEDTCTSTDDVEMIVNPLPTAIIHPIGPFCQNDPSHPLSATPPGGSWSGDNTGSQFNPSTNGPGIHTVNYRYTDGNSCTVVVSMEIEVYSIPNVIIDPDHAEACESEGAILLTAIGSGGAGSLTYNWATPSGPITGNTHNADVSGIYSVVVSDANGCTHSDVITVTIHPTPIVEIDDPGPLCGSDGLFYLTAFPPGGTYDGTITTPAGAIFPNMNPPGTYAVTYNYVDIYGCEGSDIQAITIIPKPNAFPVNNSPLCQGQQILLLGSTDGTGSIISYQWNGPGGYNSNLQNPTNATLGGTYYLTVIIDDCSSDPVETEVILTTKPGAIAQNSGPYCNGQTIQLMGSTDATGNGITYSWKGPNGYTSNLQNPTNATANGIYSLIVTVGSCVSDTAKTEVIFGTPPDVDALNSGPYCTGDTVQLFGNTSTTGNDTSFIWTGPNGFSSSDQNPLGTFDPGVYKLVVNVDGCNSAFDSTIVIVNALPQPVITGQDTFCTGFSALLDAGAGYIDYKWDDASMNQTLEVFATGVHSVTVTDANGCIGQASFSVTETNSLTPIISGILAFCEGSSTILDAGAGFASYTWSSGDTTQTIIVTDGDNYGVIVEDDDGCIGSANITTTVHANPNVMIGGSSTFCIGGFTILDAGPGYSTYEWSNDSTSQTIKVTNPGIYSVDIVDNNGCIGSASVDVQESTSLNPVITGNDAFCENGNTTLNAGSGFATYLWSDGSKDQNLVVSVAGIYSVTVSDGQSCSGESSITVIEVLPPSAEVLTETEICNTQAGGSILNLYDLVISGDMNGSWEDVDNSGAVGLFDNLNFDNVAAGNYKFIYTTNSAIDPCPEESYEVVVTVLECNCPDVFFFDSDPLCNAGDQLDLSDIENTSEPGTWEMIQTPPGIQPGTLTGTIFNATAGDPGDYTFQFVLQNPPPPGCPVDFQILVKVDQEVDAGVAAQPVSFCFNEDEIVNLAGLINGADPNGVWTETSSSPSQGNAFDPVTAIFKTNNQVANNYTFEYTLGSNGACPADATEVAVIINPLPTAVVDDDVALDCSNPTQKLDATGSSSGQDYDNLWTGPGIVIDGNENSLTPTIDQAGNYTLTITNKITGCLNTTSVTVIANTDPPTGALITVQNPGCFGDQDASIKIDQVIGGTPPYQYSLNNEPFGSNNIFGNLDAGIHSIVTMDDNGCRWDTMITIEEPFEISIDLGPDLEVEFGDDTTVVAVINLPLDQLDTLIWSPDEIIECIDQVCLEATVHTYKTVTLTATVVDEFGCEVSDDITIKVKKTRRIYFPSTFSPNDDGTNDVFFISGANSQIKRINTFQIFNRWGDKMYEALDFQVNDPSKGWDGRFRNEMMNPGVYVYLAEVEFVDGLMQVFSGDVTVIR